MIVQFEILQDSADRLLAMLPSIGFVYNPDLPESETAQKWDFFVKKTLADWDSEVFNYERSLAIANEPNDSAALQASRYQIIIDDIWSDKESEWIEGEALEIGQVRTWDNKRYVVVQSHTTQAGWQPPNVPALFVYKPSPNDGDLYPQWIQPTGAQDAYALGARVTHNSLNWESQYNANVWEPGVFGWIQI
jgi:hypothetical protein